MTPHFQGLQATRWGWERLVRQPDQAHMPPQMFNKGHVAPGTWMEESKRGGRTLLHPELWLGAL